MELPVLRFYRHQSIDKVRWDKCIQQSKNGLVYATTWYLDAVTDEKWDALISDDFQWVMPLPLKKKAGITYLPTPLFVQQLGIFGPGPFSPEVCNHFLRNLAANVSLIEFQLNAENDPGTPEGFSLRKRTNFLLDLPEDRSLLWNGFSENTQRNIRKAEKSSLSLSTSSVRNMINLFIENRGHDIKWTPHHTHTLEQLYNMCMMRGYGVSLGAYNPSGELIAGVFIMQWRERATFIFSGNSEQGKETGAMPALLYKYMLEAPPHIRIFDFEGSDDPGLARFYAGFGAYNLNYVHLKRNRLPIYLRWMKS